MSTDAMVPVGEIARGLMISHGGAGTLAMALMPDEEFSQRLAALKRGQERIRTIKRELMVEDSHYGTIPGTDKPTLLKPGAEVLCSIYGLRADFVPAIEYGDGETQPAIRVSMRCELHLGDLAGPVVAVGYGAANSWERKHRYRRGDRACPSCGVIGSVIKGKADFGGGWLCWAKKGGCGTKWPAGTAEIESQAVGDVLNPDQHDLENTLVKMAKKRSHIDAALTGTASSDLFTQDLDEQEHHEPAAPKAAAKEPPYVVSPGVPRVEPSEGTSTTRTVSDSDDSDWPNDPDAHERHGVEPAKPAPKVASRKAPAGDSPACPHCQSAGRVKPSRYPKPGGTHFCSACSAAFEPGMAL